MATSRNNRKMILTSNVRRAPCIPGGAQPGDNMPSLPIDDDWDAEPTEEQIEAMDEAKQQEYDDVDSFNASEMDGSKHRRMR